MRADAIRLQPRAHYEAIQRLIGTNFSLFQDGAIDAGVLNARLAEAASADPFGLLLLLPEGPGTQDRRAFLERVGQAAGADRDWAVGLAQTLDSMPELPKIPAEVQESFASALPAYLSAADFLAQITAITQRLDLDAGSVFDDFRLMADIADQLSPLLGYRDYLRPQGRGFVPPGGTDAEWGEGYLGGNALFVDLFATSAARAADAVKTASRIEAAPPRLQAQLYGWLSNPSFEYFMNMGPTPADLPPAIATAAPHLAGLHQEVTARLMTEFAQTEAEILAG